MPACFWYSKTRYMLAPVLGCMPRGVYGLDCPKSLILDILHCKWALCAALVPALAQTRNFQGCFLMVLEGF